MCIILEPQTNHIPRNNPQALKIEVDSKIGPNSPLRLRLIRTDKLLVEATDVKCAQAAAEISCILHIPIKAYIQKETITSFSVIHNIDRNIRLEDLGCEIQAENC